MSQYLSAALPWVLYLTLLAVIVTGLFLNILGLPGLWLIVVGVIAYAWWFDFTYVGWWTVGIVVALGVIAEIIEFVAGAAGSAKAGGSKRGMAGAIIGGIVGGIVGTPLIPIPIVGTIVGSVAGSFGGAYLVEWGIGRTHTDATAISFGAAKGRIFGLVAKSACGIAMGMVAAVAAIPIQWGRNPSGPLPPAATTPVATTSPATQP